MNIEIPKTCLNCPNIEALKMAIINSELELNKENLLKIISNLKRVCDGKCQEKDQDLPKNKL